MIEQIQHFSRMGRRVWVFLWLANNVSEVVTQCDGDQEGVVRQGAPIPLADITSDVLMDERTARRHIDWLAKENFIRTFGDRSVHIPNWVQVAKLMENLQRMF